MEPCFDSIAIIGVGLLGASLGLAVKARGMAREVRGVGHRPASLEVARAIGAVDAVFLDAAEAAPGAEMIVICTPAALAAPMLDTLLPHCGADTVVTDVASTKAVLCRHAAQTWPRPRRFVGSHPMAGSEKYGAAHGRADLYDGTVTLIEAQTDEHDPTAYDTVKGLWEAVGSRTFAVDPETHDALVARTSHIPHIVAGCLAQIAAAEGDVRPFVGKGFRDTTRVAAGRPEIWRDICLTNREAIVAGLSAMSAELDRVRALVEQTDKDGLERFFAEAQEAREKALGE